jgi:hypothetical protein
MWTILFFGFQMAVLIEIRGDQRREYRLADHTVLGRGGGASIQLDDPLVSREHARIVKNGDGRYEIADLKSRHGTFVAAERIRQRVLDDGDEIVIGASRFRFHREFESVGGRRWTERVPCDLEVMVTLPNGDEAEGRALDMSIGGMKLLLDRSIEANTLVTLAIAFPERWRKVRTQARVARIGSPGNDIGVSFVCSGRVQLTLAQEFALLLRANQAKRGETG